LQEYIRKFWQLFINKVCFKKNQRFKISSQLKIDYPMESPNVDS
jgi:hypothetical protein